MYALDPMFKMLAVRTRVRIIESLARTGPMTHADLSARMEKPLGVWTHLQKMVHAGLLLREDVDESNVRYHLNKEAFRALAQWMLDIAEVAEGKEEVREAVLEAAT
jgi:DNA-binding transcriptional ArsR family regulator